MLKTIDPRTTPDLLYTLAAMGHGDEIAVVDVNFPARSTAGAAPVIELVGMSAPEAVDVILRLLPLDSYVDIPCLRMEVIGDPNRWEPVQMEVRSVIEKNEGAGALMGGTERFAFYERASKAFAIVRTDGRRFYGCFLLKKGVIPPD